MIKVILKDPKENTNPNSFDYRKYLLRQKIYKTGFVAVNNIQIVNINTGFNLKHLTLQLRDWLLSRTKLLLGETEAADLSCGLLFGYRDEIDEDTEQRFVNSGAVHLLAVSGMHVILIYSNIRWLLRLLRLHKIISERGISIISIIMIWIFSFMVGLAASCLLYTSPSPRDRTRSRMPSSA